MAYKELNNVVFCGDKDCRKVYRFDNSDDGNLIREGHEAGLMLEWLHKNDAIKPNAYDLIEQHGGAFEDGLNFRVPESDLTWEEMIYDLDAE